MRTLSDFLKGIILGFTLGAAGGLLASPKSGEEVQQTLRDRWQEAIDEGRAAQAAKQAELERRAGIRPA
ncbi:MAG: YtxH domain-containing protein [Anaerolineae bacterium]|nr:YtxH domain-containing protein [Anaerolineae bacterium]